MKKIILILLIATGTFQAYTQEWFQVGAKWTYSVEHIYPGASNSWTAHMECVKDTLIDDITAKVIVGGGGCGAKYEENIFYYNDSTDILYYYVDEVFRTYFDFSKNAGESYYMYFPAIATENPYDSLLITVDSVIVQPVAGIDVRYQYVTVERRRDVLHYLFNGPIIEYLGPLPLFPHYEACDVSWLSELRCFHDDTFSYYAKPIYEERGCEVNLSVNELPYGKTLSVYPNPADNFITIENTDRNSSVIYELFDIQGKVLKQGSLYEENTTINISHLHKGIYFIRFIDKQSVVSINKIVKL